MTVNVVLLANSGTLPRRTRCAQSDKIDRHLTTWRATEKQQQERNDEAELRDFERDYGIGFYHG